MHTLVPTLQCEIFAGVLEEAMSKETTIQMLNRIKWVTKNRVTETLLQKNGVKSPI